MTAYALVENGLVAKVSMPASENLIDPGKGLPRLKYQPQPAAVRDKSGLGKLRGLTTIKIVSQ